MDAKGFEERRGVLKVYVGPGGELGRERIHGTAALSEGGPTVGKGKELTRTGLRVGKGGVCVGFWALEGNWGVG